MDPIPQDVYQSLQTMKGLASLMADLQTMGNGMRSPQARIHQAFAANVLLESDEHVLLQLRRQYVIENPCHIPNQIARSIANIDLLNALFQTHHSIRRATQRPCIMNMYAIESIKATRSLLGMFSCEQRPCQHDIELAMYLRAPQVVVVAYANYAATLQANLEQKVWEEALSALALLNQGCRTSKLVVELKIQVLRWAIQAHLRAGQHVLAEQRTWNIVQLLIDSQSIIAHLLLALEIQRKLPVRLYSRRLHTLQEISSKLMAYPTLCWDLIHDESWRSESFLLGRALVLFGGAHESVTTWILPRLMEACAKVDDVPRMNFLKCCLEESNRLDRLRVTAPATSSTVLAGYYPGRPNVCTNCGQSETTSTRVCNQCQAVWYCSSRCQQAHWKTSHRYLCKVRN